MMLENSILLLCAWGS